jgi:hypothetical protein
VSWSQISGTLNALPARRGEEEGTYLWIEAGTYSEAMQAELFLPAVAADRLDGAMGIALGTVHQGQVERTGELRLLFGRVRDGRGVVSATGAGIDTDISFTLSNHPPGGGFCSHCGGALEVEVMSIITPPDGGVIGNPRAHCPACGAS